MSDNLRTPKPEPVDEESDEGEINEELPSQSQRAATPPAPRRFRSRSREPEPSAAPSQITIPDGCCMKSEIREVKGKYPFKHELYYRFSLVNTDADAVDVDEHPEHCQVALKALNSDHSLVFSSDDINEKDVINRFAIEKASLNGRATYFVVRNDAVAQRRYFDLSKDFPNIAFLSLEKGSTITKNCLLFVVTIDVIRLLLFTGSDRFGNGIVIFDDCDFIGDPTKGSFYEETIAMLEFSLLVLHFRRIENAGQFARWLTVIFNRAVEAVTVESVVSPIQHFVSFYDGGRGETMNLIVDKKGKFYEDGLKFLETEKTGSKSKKPDRKNYELSLFELQDTYIRLIRTARGLNEVPILVYCQNTEDVEGFANKLTNFNFNAGKFNQNVKTEDLFGDQLKVAHYIDSYLMTLDKKEIENPLITSLIQFAVRGIGVYHAGMLPILREIIEQLFIDGLIKVIFGDKIIFEESNMRFRSVIINDSRIEIEKGYSRFMTSEEYGEIIKYVSTNTPDTNPFVVTVSKRTIPLDVAKNMFLPKTKYIQSNYKFTASTVLNSYRNTAASVHDARVDMKYLLQKIFTTHQRTEASKEILNDIRNKSVMIESMVIRDVEDLERYDSLINTLDADTVYSEMMKHENIKDWLQVGRVIKAKYNGHDFGKGLILQSPGSKTIVCAFRCTYESYEAEDPKALRPRIEGDPEIMVPIKIKITDITRIYEECLQLPVHANFSNIRDWLLWCFTLDEKISTEYKELDPIKDITINDEHFLGVWKVYQKNLKDAEAIKKLSDDFDERWQVYKEKEKLKKELELMEDIKESPKLDDLTEQFFDIKSFLSPLDMFDSNNKLTLKGTFAANLLTPHGLLISDVLFNNKLIEGILSADNIIKLLSYLIEIDVKDEFIKCPEIEEMDIIKAAVMKYASVWQEKTKESGTKMEKKFHHTLMSAIDLLCTSYRPFESLCKSINCTIREGYLAGYIKKFDKLLSEIIANKDYLSNIYDESFWDAFNKIREGRIQKGLPTATIADGCIIISKTTLGRLNEY